MHQERHLRMDCRRKKPVYYRPMDVSAALHPTQGTAFLAEAACLEEAFGWPGATRAEYLKAMLRRARLTVTELSTATAQVYGERSNYFIPPTFLYKLSRGVTPHVCQVAALSEMTGYRFVDCAELLAFDLRQIPRLQMRLHAERTVLVTPIDFGSGSTDFPDSAPFLFAGVGRRDSLCLGLSPGSLVRVARWDEETWRSRGGSAPLSEAVWLVEHPEGLSCSQVRWLDKDHIALFPGHPPWGGWPLRMPNEARILGRVEVRCGESGSRPLPACPRRQTLDQYFVPSCAEGRRSAADLLRISRRRAGVTFREAHAITHAVASALGEPGYAIALGLLSDYEAMARVPRRMDKIISLCIAYCMDVRQFLAAGGVLIDDSAKLPLRLHDPWPELAFGQFETADPLKARSAGAA